MYYITSLISSPSKSNAKDELSVTSLSCVNETQITYHFSCQNDNKGNSEQGSENLYQQIMDSCTQVVNNYKIKVNQNILFFRTLNWKKQNPLDNS